jgi:S-adenosylmethionine/arginine decarboxylase-like enzyme
LRDVLCDAARAGGAVVVGEAFHVFPNGAVTGVLVLAQSHLSIHTWPEFALANVDLLSFGDVRGDVVLGAVCDGLKRRALETSSASACDWLRQASSCARSRRPSASPRARRVCAR